MRTLAIRLAVLTLALCTACASRRSTSGPSKTDRNELSQTEIRAQMFTDAYQLIEALRSNWLRTRGADSFNTPTQIWVYMDDSRVGGTETLRNIAPLTIGYIRHYDGVSATARWGLGHGQGVIYVSSRAKEARTDRRER